MNPAMSAGFAPLVSRERAGNAIGDALRLYVGRGRRYSVKQLSNATGVKDRVIECAICDAGSADYRPLPPEALLSLMLFLGAEFTNEWIGLAQQGAFDLPETAEPDPASVLVTSAENTATIARCAADGVFDGDERRELGRVGQRKIETGMRLVAAARAA